MNNYKFKRTFLNHNNNNNNKNNLSFSIRNINYINNKINSPKKHFFNRINSNEIIYKNKNFNLIFSEKESRNLKKNLLLEKYSDLYKSVKKRKKFLSINNNINNNNNLKNIKNSKENKNQTKNFINLNLNFIDQIKKEIKRIKLIQKNNPILNKKKNLSQTFLNSLNTTLNKDFSSNSIKKTSKDFLTIQKQNYEYTNKKIPYIIKCMNKNNNNNNNNNNNIFPHTQYYENRYKKQNINLKDILINHNMNSRKDLNSNSFPKIKYKQNQMKNLFKFQNLKNKEILDIIKEKKLQTKLKTIKFNKFDLLSKFLNKQSI